MASFKQVPSNLLSNVQYDAGVILKSFDVNDVNVTAGDIVCATTGGINASCVPSYSDLGDDIDNCPTNTKELKHLDGWECKMSFTSVGVSSEVIRLALGAADVGNEENTDDDGKDISPRESLKDKDFSDIWWVGDLVGGGMAAIQLSNALSTGGLTLQTTKNGKGQISVELTGHISIKNSSSVPMHFYVSED